MIHVVTTSRNAHPWRCYLESYGARQADRIALRTYEDACVMQEPPGGAWIFCDVEILGDEERERAGALHERLAARGGRVLNHPRGSLRRFDLLRVLHRRGLNGFDVHRPGEPIAPERFPVFLRREQDHEGSRTPLLRTPAELEQALAQAADGAPADLMVVEFLATADEQGLYRKYGAFVVGERILPRHLFFSRGWEVKDWDLYDARLAREERRYLVENPHQASLREALAVAGVSYGRVDYALHRGRVQVWEVNTNPMIAGMGRLRGLPGVWARLPRTLRGLAAPALSFAIPRARVHARFVAALEAAWDALDRGA